MSASVDVSSGWAWLRRVAGTQEPVSRNFYAVTGCQLAVFKYLVEATVLWRSLDVLYWPWDFLNPMLTARFAMVQGGREWLGWLWFAWTLPFLWIAMSMSVRRAVDAGKSPWRGMAMLVPIINLYQMLILSILPSRPSADRSPLEPAAPPSSHDIRDAAMAVGIGLMMGAAMLLFSVSFLQSYGSSLFVGTPTMMSAVSVYLYGRKRPRTYTASFGLGLAVVVCAGLGMLLFALEGAICIMMAVPLCLPLGMMGALIGKTIADASRSPTSTGLFSCIALLPVWTVVEYQTCQPLESSVTTSVIIQTPVEAVWPHVIEFPDLPPDTDLLFRLGIASPLRARIFGTGVGAIRHCEFTTGTFVEPITVWNPPAHLAFDVTAQPIPMQELSPHGDIQPPHLDGFMKSTRGEFRLIRRDDNSTELRGTTWYQVNMFPQSYWTLWCDHIVHRIHRRVLNHIQATTLQENADH